MAPVSERLKLRTKEEVEEINANSKFKRLYKQVTLPDGAIRYQYDALASFDRAQQELSETFLPLSGSILDFMADGNRRE